MLALATLEIRNGNFTIATDIFQSALSSSKSSSDSAKVYFGIDGYYELRGQMKKSLENHLLGMDAFSRNNPPKNVLVQSTFSVEKYVFAGKGDAALKLLEKIENEFQPPLDKVAAFGYIFYYIAMENPDNAEKYIPDAMEVISDFGEQVLMANVYYAKGRIAELRMDYKVALENYTQFARMQPNSFQAYQWISMCHRELGDLNNAIENISIALKHNPFNPEFNLEAAMVYVKTGEQSKVKEHLDRALKIWENADKEYKPYQNAIKAYSQMNGI
jgi:tetratricopeptide (TPR) repeat protein